MSDNDEIVAVAMGAAVAIQAIADPLIARDPALRVAIEERFEEHLGKLSIVPEPHLRRSARVPHMLSTALRELNPDRRPPA